jgi:L-rhamnose isomerase
MLHLHEVGHEFRDFSGFHRQRKCRRMMGWHEDYQALGRQLARRGISIEAMTERAMAYSVAVPTWGVGTGGTRSRASPVPASRATSTTSWKTAASSTS